MVNLFPSFSIAVDRTSKINSHQMEFQHVFELGRFLLFVNHEMHDMLTLNLTLDPKPKVFHECKTHVHMNQSFTPQIFHSIGDSSSLPLSVVWNWKMQMKSTQNVNKRKVSHLTFRSSFFFSRSYFGWNVVFDTEFSHYFSFWCSNPMPKHTRTAIWNSKIPHQCHWVLAAELQRVKIAKLWDLRLLFSRFSACHPAFP